MTGTNGPVFANYDAENMTELDEGYVSPDRVFKGPETVDPIPLSSPQEIPVEWGIWNASVHAPAGLYADPYYGEPAELLTEPFYYVKAAPADVANRAASISFDTYTCQWSADGADDACWGALSSIGPVSSFASGLSMNFKDGVGMVTISLETGTEGGYWVVDVQGSLQGNQFITDSLTNSYLWTMDGAYTDSTGEVTGYFIDGPDRLYFVGGFQLESAEAGQRTDGVMLLKEAYTDR